MSAQKAKRILSALAGIVGAIALTAFLVGGAPPVQAQSQATPPEEACPPPPARPAAMPSRADWTDRPDVRLAQVNVDAAYAAQNNPASLAQVMPQLAPSLAVCAAVNPRSNSGNVAAYACAGQAGFLLARSSANPDAEYQKAYCAYTAVTALAATQTAPERRALLARAYEGRGRVREARAAVNLSLSGYYRLNAIADYERAAQIQPTHARYLALAEGQSEAAKTDSRLWAAANTSYDALQGLPADETSFPTLKRAAALRAQARVQEKDPARFTPASVRALWERANRADPSAEGQYEYAKSLLASGMPGALDAFRAAARMPSAPTGGVNYAALAAYNAALIGARTASSRPAWVAVFEDARGGAGAPNASRMLCIAYIGAGGEPLSRDDSTAPCKAVMNDAEGQLLRGMYLLRRVQFLPPECTAPDQKDCTPRRRTAAYALIDEAVVAFSATAGGDSVFNWLDAQPQPVEPKLNDLLQYGRLVALTMRSCGPTPPGAPAVQNVFTRLDLMGCLPH
jgi:hypothetical protein